MIIIFLINDDSDKLVDEKPIPNKLKELVNYEIKINLTLNLKQIINRSNWNLNKFE
jgi:hypothetical protein